MAEKNDLNDFIVLSLGGSLIYPQEIAVDYLQQFRKLILSYVSQGKRFGIVCGGGWICREYIKRANEVFPLQPIQNDIVGIATTRTNAQLIREIFGAAAYQEVVIDYSKRIVTDKAVIVGAGWKPGCSTDKDAVLLASLFGAKTVVNLTNVDYVYNKDPRKYKDAQPITTISWKDFKQLVGGEWKAGMNLPFDPVAASLAEKNKMAVVILNGTPLKNLEDFLSGKRFVGTLIVKDTIY